jgi:hypothetical protein
VKARVVSNDTAAVIEELKRLANTRYHGRPVSLYGGMVELPLIVTREDAVQWFGDTAELVEERLWAQRDAENRLETENMARELRDNLVGRRLWVELEAATRNFLASAEAVFRTRRDDPRFDFSGPAIGYAKAVETELNALLFPLLRRGLRGRPPAEREAVVDGRKLDLGGAVPHQSLGTLRNLLQRNDAVRGGIRRLAPGNAEWLLSLPERLAGLADLRNPAAHHGRAMREAVSDAREEVLGIGCRGLLVEIAEAKARAG